MSRTVLVMLVVLTLGMTALLGVGIARGSPPEKDDRNPFAKDSPLALPGLPNLPPGVTLDANGILTGVALATEPGTTMLEWSTLRAYEYSAAGLGDLPDALKALDGKRVTMVGFLLPLYEWDDIHQFALVGSHWSCCFGVPAGLNGTMNTTLAKGHAGLENSMEPLRVVGTFHVRETRESGWLVSIYSLDDATAAPLR
jgi:hypothetical protein